MVKANKYKGHHSDEYGLFEVFWDSGWYWRTEEEPDNIEGPFKTSFDAWLAATNLDFSINHGGVSQGE